MNKAQIIAKVEEVYKKADAMFNLDFALPDVEFFRNKKAAGYAYRYKNKVAFNLDYAEANSDTFVDTIIHEIAHLVTWDVYPVSAKQAHGPQFKMIDKMLGGRGTTFNNYKLPESYVEKKRPYVYACSCKEHNISTRTHNKILSGSTYSCKLCRTKITLVKSMKEAA